MEDTDIGLKKNNLSCCKQYMALKLIKPTPYTFYLLKCFFF